ncbi:MAG: hypothetical protein MUO58_17280 [Anaerolineales bacterium]|nr:hypothetical protein [Anaerolineales bacterium]HUS84627.1 hypothetical protein [Anaerolineales bacterium]
MKGNKKIGITLAIVGILTALLLLYLMADIYMPTVEGKILDGRPDEAVTVRIVFALLGWVGISAGALWVVVLYGFQNNKDWAWVLGSVAAMAQIVAGFFPMIPPASIGMPFPTIWVFLIAFALWFGMLLIGGVQKKILTLLFFSGIAYVLTFMDGVGAISRYQTVDESFAIGMYGISQMVNWWGAAAWAVFIFAVIKGKSWALPVGIFAASMSIFGGYPVGLTDVIRLGRFSMFLPAPIIGTILLVVLLLPATKKLIENQGGK